MLDSFVFCMIVDATRANRRSSDFEEENWSEGIAVSANFLRCEPSTYTMTCIWIPDDEDMKTVRGIR